jgi:hypothetical protein
MLHVDARTASRRTVRRSRVFGWFIVVATCLVGGCDADQDHPPFAPCGTLDGAIARMDAGPDSGKIAFVSCGDTTKVPVGGAVPPGGPPANSGGGDINGGIGGSGAGIGGNGAGLGGIDGVGAGGVLSGIGGTTPGFGGGAATTGSGATGTGIGGIPFGSPGIGGLGP